MTRLAGTQTLILTSAASRPGNLAMPLPKGVHGAAAKKVVMLMTKHGLIEEVEVDQRCEVPLWRETGDGRGTTLIATEAGLAAIGIEPVVAQAMAGLRKPSSETQEPAPVNLRKENKAGRTDSSVADALWCQCSRNHRRDRLAGPFRARGHLGPAEEEVGVGCHLREGRGPGRVYRIGAPGE
jgi:hypothetical protein